VLMSQGCGERITSISKALYNERAERQTVKCIKLPTQRALFTIF